MTTPNPTAVPLIDRVSELGWLRTTAEEMLADRTGRLVAVVGARGVGKSRVADAFATWCAGRGMVVLTAQCVGRAAEPLLPIRDALRPVLGTTARAVRGVLRRAAPDLLEGVPVIGKFLAGLGRELSAGPQVGGDTPRGLYDVLSTVIVKLGGEQGLLLLIEDAHVADPDTLSFLTYLLNKSREQPALIVVTVPAEEAGNPAIADYLSEWEEKGADTLAVGPFARADVGTYLETVLGAEAVDESTVDFMVGFTGGNALLLGESVRHLTTAGGLARLTGGPAEVPDRIRRLLERRLTRLDEQTRAFVGVAAVVGEASHELTPIVRVLGVDDPTGLAALGRACAAGVLSEEDDGRIVFTSELLRMVAYAQLAANHRRSLHLRAGEWFADQQQYSEAAHHYERGGDWRRMLPVAFLAAGAAEHVGLYHAAVWWYRRIQPHASPPDLFPRLANALLVVGEWAEAERLLEALPTDEPATLMLRSRLCFVRGDITGAAEHARRALGGEPAEDVEALTCLASINLYAGDFATAAGYAERAQRIARAAGSVNDQARCHIVRGACLLYNGDPAAAERSFRDGIFLLDSAPPATRGVGVYSALLGNRGFAEEVRGAWREADESHREALRLRREVADAVGELESTLAVGRVALGLSDPTTATEFLTAAQRLAEDLGEELQQAKIIHARGEVAARTGDTSAAVDLVHDARSRFIKCGTPYDIAFADLSLARILADTRPREAIERLASGRAAVQTRGFGLLRTLYPEVDPPLADRIHAGLLGYMAGDAFGLPWEGLPPQETRPADLDDLPARGPWNSGDTSDDTALTRLVAEHLGTARGLGDPEQFMRTVADRADQIPGLGPSTRRAIERFTETGAADGGDSDTNGAPMRALPVGWAVPLADEPRRREWTLALTRPTHGGRAAQTAACVMSACAAWALEGATPDLLALIAAEEAAAVGPDTGVATALDEVRRGGWTPPTAGIGLDPAQTVAAALHCCLASGGDLDAALRVAVDLGGDTDTVAALTGGLLASGLRPTDVRQRLAWLGRVRLPDEDETGRLATALAGIRVAGDG